MIPHMAFRNNGKPGVRVIAADDLTGGADAFRSLRTTLRFMRAEFPKVLAVTSPGPGEGKSLISANLAVSLAQQGWRVLLIDGDLRRPQQHTIFGLARVPGLSDLLIGVASVEAVTNRDAEDGVDVITCGTHTHGPAELLGSSAFRDLVQGSRAAYDAVVIDTPPVLIGAESAALTALVDGIMVTARSKLTNRYALRQAIEQLRQVRAPILGVLVNDVPRTRGYGRYSSYAGYYGYKYYQPHYAERGGGDQRTPSRIRSMFTSERG
jgi:capsular exopolysaccharide synthesis family protein